MAFDESQKASLKQNSIVKFEASSYQEFERTYGKPILGKIIGPSLAKSSPH